MINSKDRKKKLTVKDRQLNGRTDKWIDGHKDTQTYRQLEL